MQCSTPTLDGQLKLNAELVQSGLDKDKRIALLLRTLDEVTEKNKRLEHALGRSTVLGLRRMAST